MTRHVLHDEYAYLTPLGIVRGCSQCGREVGGYTPLLLPCPQQPTPPGMPEHPVGVGQDAGSPIRDG